MNDLGLLQTISSAYRLAEPARTKKIHDGTNRVYAFDYSAGSRHQRLAVKVSSVNGERSVASKRAERFVLDNIRSQIPCVPKMLVPDNEPEQTKRYSWGLLWNDDILVSVYEWVPSKPYHGLKQQLKQLGKSFVRLQHALCSVNTSCFKAILNPPQRFRSTDNKLTLKDTFTFSDFQSFVDQNANVSRTCALVQDCSRFLENEICELRKLIGKHKQFDNTILSLVHLELSPSNIGFNEDHTVAAIFDFDSISYGLPLQDTAWLLATFCVDYRRSINQVITDVTTLLLAIQSLQPLSIDQRKLLIPFMRLGYLDSIYRELQRARDNVDKRLGFAKEDIFCLLWLRQHDRELMSAIKQVESE
jgi:Ser/Thr protein kinase RdoA (MazF antagonist)